MAGWSTSLRFEHEALTQAIFSIKDIGCKVEFCFIPRFYEWQAFFKTKFKYLTLDELVSFEPDFLRTYDDFVSRIEKIRNQILREYNLYFNELWC